MIFYAIAAAVAVFCALATGVCLADGGVRGALQFALANRLGGLVTPTLIVAGDSLAASCPWSKLFPRPLAVLNLATGGATIKEIGGQLHRARDIQAEWIVIDGGLNDLLFDGAQPEEIERDFCALLRRIPQTRRVIVTLMPYVADAAQTARIDAANRRLSRRCEKRGLHVIDLNPMIARGGVRMSDMTQDGLHLSQKAERIWLEAVRGVIQHRQ
jgi:lysophospholipase L1-like esterase